MIRYIFVYLYICVLLMLLRNMSSKAKNKKEEKKGEEQDFETFVRVTLGTLQESVNAIQSAQGQLMSDLNLLKDRVSSNADTLLGISTKQESFATNFDKVDGEIHDINCKIEKMEQGMANNTFMINSLYERLFALERYSRGFNLRFYKVPEQTGEDCIVTLGKIISKDLKQKPVIENAHRVGPSRDDGSPHPIIAKFLYRPDRRDILRNKKLFKNGTYVSEDLIPEDRKRKNDLKAVMQEAYESGKRPKFRNGKLYIDGIPYNS